MNKRLPLVEWLAGAGALIGLAAKWNLAPIGNLLLVLGLGSLGLIYFLRAFLPLPTTRQAWVADTASDTGPSPPSPAPTAEADFLRAAVLPKITGISAAVVFIGTLFKLLNFPGSRNMLVVGTATLLIVVVLLALRQQVSRPAAVVGVLGAVMLLLPSETLVRQFHRDDPALVEKLIYQLHHPRDRAANEAVRQHLQRQRLTN